MPNTNPVCDEGSAVRFLRERAAERGKVRVHISVPGSARPVFVGIAPAVVSDAAPPVSEAEESTVLEVDRRAEANPKSDVATGAAPAKSPSRAGRPLRLRRKGARLSRPRTDN